MHERVRSLARRGGKRGKLIKAASERHASPVEACKLIGSFGQAEIKMIKYIEANAEQCGISPQIAKQLKNGHKNTKAMQKKVCTMAQQHPSADPDLNKCWGRATSGPHPLRSAVSVAIPCDLDETRRDRNRVRHLKCSVSGRF